MTKRIDPNKVTTTSRTDNSGNRECIGPCGLSFPATKDNFYFRKSANNGQSYPSSMCKKCEKDKAAKSRRDKYATEGGRKIIQDQNLKYRDTPERREAARTKQNEKYALNEDFREALKSKAISWYQDSPSNSLRKKVRAKKWFQSNKVRLREEWNERYRTDPAFRLRNNLRSAIWEALRMNGGSKAGRSILTYLPYTMEGLRHHIESLWEPWMSWDNFGILDQNVRTWQIDHIIPQVKLPYSDFSEVNFFKCWALTNLRPLEAKLNLEKGCR